MILPVDGVVHVDLNQQYLFRIVYKNEPILLDLMRHEYVVNHLQPSKEKKSFPKNKSVLSEHTKRIDFKIS